ncbi:hypothetical protein B566_EDAN005046 [Ephemera danica]|nr:hypothetical protein B566_EDAN005046 [Ephemera danica]
MDMPGGGKMPMIGYGTWQAQDAELEVALDAALETGYRHIDTAYVYENEHVVGRVLRKWIDSGRLAREELFVVTKYLGRSLERLQLDYVDLYLVHVPFGYKERGEDEIHPRDEKGNMLIDTSTDHLAIWKEMENQVTAGRVKAIGLSNFNPRQIERVVENAKIKPANLQVELHVYMQQRELDEVCRKHNVTMTAYSPLGSRGMVKIFEMLNITKELPDLFVNPVVVEIAARLKRTPAQVLLRHTLQRGIAVIPKSVTPARMKENFQLLDFELTEDDVKKLNELDQGPAARVCDFAFFGGIRNHPEFPF